MSKEAAGLRIAVIGGTGDLGGRVARRLAAAGAAVCASSRHARGGPGPSSGRQRGSRRAPPPPPQRARRSMCRGARRPRGSTVVRDELSACRDQAVGRLRWRAEPVPPGQRRLVACTAGRGDHDREAERLPERGTARHRCLDHSFLAAPSAEFRSRESRPTAADPYNQSPSSLTISRFTTSMRTRLSPSALAPHCTRSTSVTTPPRISYSRFTVSIRGCGQPANQAA